MFYGKESDRRLKSNCPAENKTPKVCSMGHARLTGAELARLGAVALAQSTSCTVLRDPRQQND